MICEYWREKRDVRRLPSPFDCVFGCDFRPWSMVERSHLSQQALPEGLYHPLARNMMNPIQRMNELSASNVESLRYRSYKIHRLNALEINANIDRH